MVVKDPYEAISQPNQKNVKAQAFLHEAGLNFTVGKVPLCNPLRPHRRIKGFYAIIRQDTLDVLAVVRDRYTVVQNQELASLIDYIAEIESIRILRCGSIGKGERWFMLLEWEENHIDVGADRVQKQVLIMGSHDAKNSNKIRITPLRLASRSSLLLPIKGFPYEWSLRHTPKVKERVADAKRLVKRSADYFGRFQEVAARMAAREVASKKADRTIHRAVSQWWGRRSPQKTIDSISQEILDLFLGFQGADQPQGIPGTAWGLLVAGAEYADQRLIRSRVPKGSTPEDQLFKSLMDGQRFKLKRAMAHSIGQELGDFTE